MDYLFIASYPIQNARPDTTKPSAPVASCRDVRNGSIYSIFEFFRSCPDIRPSPGKNVVPFRVMVRTGRGARATVFVARGPVSEADVLNSLGYQCMPDGFVSFFCLDGLSKRMKKHVFEMKGLRKILRVSWTVKKTNEWVLNKAGVKTPSKQGS